MFAIELSILSHQRYGRRITGQAVRPYPHLTSRAGNAKVARLPTVLTGTLPPRLPLQDELFVPAALIARDHPFVAIARKT